MYRCAVIPQIITQMFGQSLNGRLGCVVRYITRRVGDPLLASCNYDGGRLVRASLLKAGNKGVKAINDTKQIYI
jgi:hypothetical protein